jgi:hypothetical protein
MKKSSIRKIFNNFVWSPLSSRGNILYIKNFAFKFTFRCLQPDIVPIDTGGKFAIGVVDTGGNLPPGSLTSPANLPPVSTTQGEQVAKFAAGVVDTGLRISPRMFEKIRNDPDVIIRGLGEGDS